jgi:hypothetical protein
MKNPLVTRWQPLIGHDVIRGWAVTARNADHARELIHAEMTRVGVWGTLGNWIAGGRAVAPVQEPLKAEA